MAGKRTAGVGPGGGDGEDREQTKAAKRTRGGQLKVSSIAICHRAAAPLCLSSVGRVKPGGPHRVGLLHRVLSFTENVFVSY